MHQTIRCCTSSCSSSALVGDGLIEDAQGKRGVNSLRTLAGSLGWVECEHSTSDQICFRCPEHADEAD